MNALNDNLARIIGPVIGGAVAASIGITGVVVLNTVTYAAAAALIALIRPASEAGKPTTNPAADHRNFVREWIDGLHCIRGSRAVLVVFVTTAIVLLGDSMFSALLAP